MIKASTAFHRLHIKTPSLPHQKSMHQASVHLDAGFSLLEVLVATVVLTTAVMAVSHSSITASMAVRKSIEFSTAEFLAESILEEYSTRDPSTYDDSDGSQETVKQNGISYNIKTSVTLGAHDGRDVRVTVVPAHSRSGTEIIKRQFFTLWKRPE